MTIRCLPNDPKKALGTGIPGAQHPEKRVFYPLLLGNRGRHQAGRRGVEETLGVRRAGEAAGVSELLEEIPEKKKRQVFFKFTNKNSLIF